MNRANGMKRTAIRKVSEKQKVELRKRRKLKAELIAEFGEHCMTCKDENRDWRGIALSHIIPLSRGGETSRENCVIECYICHERYEKHAELREGNCPHHWHATTYPVKGLCHEVCKLCGTEQDSFGANHLLKAELSLVNSKWPKEKKLQKLQELAEIKKRPVYLADITGKRNNRGNR